MDELIKTYKDLRAQEEVLKEKIEEQKRIIMREMEQLGMDKHESEYGTCVLSERKTWQFPKEIKSNWKQYVDEQKEEAIESGQATEQITRVLTYKG